MGSDLYGGLRTIANAAFTMRDLTLDCAEALALAQARMPPPVEVPELPATIVRLATVPVPVDPSASAESVALLRQQQSEAADALRAQQQAAQASSVAQRFRSSIHDCGR